MYNGNGNGNYTNNGGSTTIGGFRIKPIYLYAAGLVAVLLAIFFILRFLNTSLALHFGAFAGVLLLIANLRELIGQGYAQRGSTALLNILVGGGLIFAWLAQFFGALLWVPAIALLAVATPLILGRAAVYTSYVNAARTAVNGIRRTVGR